MSGFGMSGLVMAMLVVAVMALVSRRAGNRAGVTLALSRFRISEDPGAEECIEIAGRPAGIVGFLLNAIGLTDETKLVVRGDLIEHTESSLAGFQTTVVRLADVASTACGYRKPLGAAAAAAACVLFGVTVGLAADSAGALLFGLVLGGAFAAFYVTQQCITISATSIGGSTVQVAFKQSLLDGIMVDLPRAKAAMNILNAKVDSRKRHAMAMAAAR